MTDVPAWFVKEIERERDRLLRLVDPFGTLVPDERGMKYLEALQSVQSLIFRAREGEQA